MNILEKIDRVLYEKKKQSKEELAADFHIEKTDDENVFVLVKRLKKSFSGKELESQKEDAQIQFDSENRGKKVKILSGPTQVKKNGRSFIEIKYIDTELKNLAGIK